MAGECALCRGTRKVEIFVGCGAYVYEECPRCLRASIKRLTDLRVQVAAAHRRGQERMRERAAQAVNAHAAHYPTDVFPELRPENWRHSQPTTDAISASAIRHTCRVLADAVRALPIEEPQR